MNDELARADDITRTLELGRPHRRRRALRWLLLLALLGAVGLYLWQRPDLFRDTQQLSYRTEPARRGNLTVTVTATGTLQPTNEVQVGSELSGIVREVLVDYNDKVKKGEVLARLDTTKLAAQVQQSKASLESARANVQQAQATVVETRSQLARLRHARELSGNRVPAQQDIDTARAALDRAIAGEAAARAAVKQAEATLELNQTDLAKAVIRSPINGVVLTRSVEPGQTVAASLQAPVLFTLAEDLSKMELHVDVDEADVGKVHEGQPATFTVDAYPDRKFPARINQVRYGSQTVDGVVTYETVLGVDNSDLSLRPGMTATAEITVQTVKDALLIPNAALRYVPPQTGNGATRGGGGLLGALMPHFRHREPRSEDAADSTRKHVWVLRGGKPVRVALTVGASDGTSTVITSGKIAPGDPLVVDSTSLAR